MKKEYLAEAQKAHGELHSHLENLRHPKDVDEIEREWALVLHYADQVYQRLQHAPVTPIEKEWHRIVLEERKTDPLLQYAHQARGVEHHGLERVTTRGPGMVIQDHGNGLQTGAPGQVVKLVPVTNRGREYPVPNHGGPFELGGLNLQDIALRLEMVIRQVVRWAEHVDEHQRLEA